MSRVFLGSQNFYGYSRPVEDREAYTEPDVVSLSIILLSEMNHPQFFIFVHLTRFSSFYVFFAILPTLVITLVCVIATFITPPTPEDITARVSLLQGDLDIRTVK